MREEIKDTNWHTYGLSISDFDYTYRLIMEIIEDRKNQTLQKSEELEKENIDYEAIDDLNYYVHIDNLFLFHF